MTRKDLKDTGASVRDRLRNLAGTHRADFPLILSRYAAERFLYRLSVSAEVDHFTLKGAALFLVWARREFRVTKDVDLLGSGPADHDSVRRAITSICAIPCPEDGVTFDAQTLRLEDIREEQEYHGLRAKLTGRLSTVRLDLQVDIGFGDVVTPERREAEFPTLLQHPAPKLWTYPPETSIAEKFDAMLQLGASNTRMKDIWDIAVLATQFGFDGETLRSALEETCARRGTAITSDPPEPFRPAFHESADRQRLWSSLQAKIRPGIDAPARLDEACELVRRFLDPVRTSILQREPFVSVWPAGGPWTSARLT